MLRLILMGCASLALVDPASAEWVECNQIGAAAGPYKVLITDVIQEDAQSLAAPQRKRLLRAFQERVNERVAELRDEQVQPGFQVILCEASQPESNTEFNAARITRLNSQDVITVLWGATSIKTMRLRHVLVPYRREALAKGGDGGLVSREIQIPDTASFAELWERLSHETVVEATSAYFALGIGVRYLDASNYGHAQRYLCFAKSRFGAGARVLGVDVPKDVIGFLDAKLRELGAAMSRQPGVEEFVKLNATENCGGGR